MLHSVKQMFVESGTTASLKMTVREPSASLAQGHFYLPDCSKKVFSKNCEFTSLLSLVGGYKHRRSFWIISGKQEELVIPTELNQTKLSILLGMHMLVHL